MPSANYKYDIHWDAFVLLVDVGLSAFAFVHIPLAFLVAFFSFQSTAENNKVLEQICKLFAISFK